jgi:hypothetical protein
MDFRTKAVLMAAIEERRELVQFLYDWGFFVEGEYQYIELRALRQRMREANANSGLDNPGAHEYPAAE